jgi:hypothetical protein
MESVQIAIKSVMLLYWDAQLNVLILDCLLYTKYFINNAGMHDHITYYILEGRE